jgi:hypothetical protein
MSQCSVYRAVDYHSSATKLNQNILKCKYIIFLGILIPTDLKYSNKNVLVFFKLLIMYQLIKIIPEIIKCKITISNLFLYYTKCIFQEAIKLIPHLLSIKLKFIFFNLFLISEAVKYFSHRYHVRLRTVY